MVLNCPATVPKKMFVLPVVLQSPAQHPEKKFLEPVPPSPVNIPAPVETIFVVLQTANGPEPLPDDPV